MKAFRRILVANRGEIALRVMRTCRRMGLFVIGVYSDADADALSVRFADEAVRIGPAPSAASYLNVEAILEAARRTKAEAVHPGYGFLAENADFAEACRKAGLVFVGPSPEAIRQMGSKIEARRIMAGSGVPLVPGYDGADQSDVVFREKALEIGFPVMVKASAGGGGKGMVVVRSESEIQPALDQARRLAKSAFGDETLLLEKLIQPVRHVEVQILGDRHGSMVHCFERECSIQRRHQKIVEETPSPALSPGLREEMGKAAVRAGQAIGYENAGTVEFLLDPDGRFYFLEVNTRLQVEHPVTEMVTGLDLVELQLRVAMGEPIPFLQSELEQSGHSFECRVYAEDPAQGFLPQAGELRDWYLPPMEGVRVDGGVEAGSVVSIHYDPLLAKVVTRGRDRLQAADRMIRALESLSVQGVRTNREMLLQVLAHPAFLAGKLSTGFLEEHFPGGFTDEPDPEREESACLAVTVFRHEERRAAQPLLPGVLSGWRNSRFRDQRVGYRCGGRELEVEYQAVGSGRFEASVDGGPGRVVQVAALGEQSVILEVDGLRRGYRVISAGADCFVHSTLGSVQVVELPRFVDPGEDAEGAGGCQAPMPGRVQKVLVHAGQSVTAGQSLVILEAMKMEHVVAAPGEGTVLEVLVAEGAQVEGGAVLVEFEPAEG